MIDDQVVATKNEILYYTYMWDGERLSAGRPMVSDNLIDRLKNIKVEDVWQLLNELGYRNQFESGWEMIHDDVPIVGRVLTAQYMPRRPDVRIGQVTVIPCDVILAKRMGVVFIPPHLVEQVVITAEIVKLRDEFVHQRVQQRVYTPGQVDSRWTADIEEDFLNWLEDGNKDRLPVPLDQMQDFLQTRTW